MIYNMTSSSSIKQAPQVTYEDFVHSMTDKPQFFSFFLDKACAIAKNKGINDESLKKELALVAIEHLWCRIDKYDPSRAEFSSYFNICIGNRILDQIRSQNSDKAYCQDASEFAEADYSESVSTEGEDKLLKKREFADKMVAEFKRFIDTLSPEKRLIFCASEFGQLAMGETPSGRNYAELIAAQTGRTAAAVRKIVERLKKEAIGYAQERGFDYGAYSTHIEFITTKLKEEGDDFSDLDWAALSGVQRLMLRMYLYEKAVTDGIISEDASDEVPEEMSSYEAGKRAALESVTSILNRIEKAEVNLKQSRENRDLISFVYWFVLIHEYNYLLRSYPMPEEIQDMFDEIDSCAPKAYLEHKRECGYSRLPDYRTVYGRGYNFPDIIGCALSDRCAEEILSFEPDTEGMLVCGGELKRQNLMLHFLKTGGNRVQMDFCDVCGKNLNDQPYPYSFRCDRCGRIFNLCKDCSEKRIHLNWGKVGREPSDDYEDAVNKQMFQGE